jgi:hypothetical protein
LTSLFWARYDTRDAIGPQGPRDRACLEGFVNQYLEALVAHDPTRLPMTPDVRFTEDDIALKPGEALWKTASGLGTYKLYFADPQAGQVGFFGTIRENGRPASLVLRLKVENRRQVDRHGEYILRSDRTGQRRRRALPQGLQPVRERNPDFGTARLLGAARYAYFRLHPEDLSAALCRDRRRATTGVRVFHVQPPRRYHLDQEP